MFIEDVVHALCAWSHLILSSRYKKVNFSSALRNITRLENGPSPVRCPTHTLNRGFPTSLRGMSLPLLEDTVVQGCPRAVWQWQWQWARHRSEAGRLQELPPAGPAPPSGALPTMGQAAVR